MKRHPIRSIFTEFAGILPIEKIPFRGKHRFIFPFWHVVSDSKPAHLSNLYQILSVSEFENDLDSLQRNFRPATVEQVIRYSNSTGIPDERLFFPTFDDGLSECFYHIAPILKKRGTQAAFFVNPDFIDNKSLFHRHKASLILNRISAGKINQAAKSEAENIIQQQGKQQTLDTYLHRARFSDHATLDRLATIFEIDFADFLAREKPYMTLEQIRQLQSDGFLIGAHSMDHREFFESSELEIMEQIASSLTFLMKEINPPVKSFAFPFSDHRVPDSVFERINSARIWDISFGTAGIKDDIWRNHIQRIPMESEDTFRASQIIRREYLEYLLKKISGRNKVSRQ